MSRKRVIRLMQEDGLRARKRKRYKVTTMSDYDQPVAANLLGRQFAAAAPNQRWVSDTTEFVIASNGKLYLAAVLDLFSRCIVGWAVSAVNDRHVTIKALEMALKRRCPDIGLGDVLRIRTDLFGRKDPPFKSEVEAGGWIRSEASRQPKGQVARLQAIVRRARGAAPAEADQVIGRAAEPSIKWPVLVYRSTSGRSAGDGQSLEFVEIAASSPLGKLKRVVVPIVEANAV